MGTVLILGHSGDACCPLVQERLLDRGCGVVFLREDRVLPGLGFAWEVQGRSLRGVVRFEGQTVAFEEIDAVLCRSFGVPVTPEMYETADGRYVSSEWNAMVMAWTSEMSCPVVNRLRPELWYRVALNVTALASLAPSAPFRRPRAMVTTREEDAREFQRRCGGRVRYEPLAQPVSYLVEGEAGLRKLAGLCGALPLHLTEVIDGDRFDAFVVGRRIVLAAADGEPVGRPPEAVADDARALAGALGLAFCRLALLRTWSGDWFCLSADRLPYLYDCGNDFRNLVIDNLADLLCHSAAATGGRRP